MPEHKVRCCLLLSLNNGMATNTVIISPWTLFLNSPGCRNTCSDFLFHYYICFHSLSQMMCNDAAQTFLIHLLLNTQQYSMDRLSFFIITQHVVSCVTLFYSWYSSLGAQSHIISCYITSLKHSPHSFWKEQIECPLGGISWKHNFIRT